MPLLTSNVEHQWLTIHQKMFLWCDVLANATDMYEFTTTNCSTFAGTKYRTCHMEFSALLQTEGRYVQWVDLHGWVLIRSISGFLTCTSCFDRNVSTPSIKHTLLLQSILAVLFTHFFSVFAHIFICSVVLTLPHKPPTFPWAFFLSATCTIHFDFFKGIRSVKNMVLVQQWLQEQEKGKKNSQPTSDA